MVVHLKEKRAEETPPTPRPESLRAKRWIDVLLLLLFFVPSLLVAAVCVLLIWLVDGRPALFRQRRIGFQGREIEVWKLRTMRRDADAALERHLERNESARLEWNRNLKLRQDPRILPYLGHWLRRSSLDELPQLLNIARGEMSFVGPRPLPPYHFQHFEPDFQQLRQSVPPGLTGLWQIKERSDGDLHSHQRWDLDYINSFSLLNDLKILVVTPLVLVWGRGAR